MLKTLLKFLLAFALCYWLFTNGKLDFSLVFKAFRLGPIWFLSTLLLFCHYMATSLRFKVLLQSKSLEKVPFLKVFGFDAIGSFFSLIIPGAAGIDLVRFIYYRTIAHDVSSSTKGSLLILDRFIGLFVLMLWSAIVCFIERDYLISVNPKFLTLLYFYFSLSSILAFIISLVFLDLSSKKRLHNLISRRLAKLPKIQNVIDDVLNVKLTFKTFLKCLLISILNQALVIFSFWGFIYNFLPESFTFFNFCTIIPTGLLGVALPISPAGLGVGHVIFDNLFKLYGVGNGASLYNIYFIMNASFYLMGVFPYLLMKKEDSKESKKI